MTPELEPPHGYALVPLAACVDRALEDLSSRLALRGRVEVAPLPTLRCDGAAMCRALAVLFAAALEEPTARVRVGFQVRAEESLLVVEGAPCSARVVAYADAHLRAAGGAVRAERDRSDASFRVLVSPVAKEALARTPRTAGPDR